MARLGKPNKMQQALRPHVATVLSGTVLAIDPSSGSRNSQPGYALLQRGQLVDSGLLRIGSGRALHSRLYDLAHTLRESFEEPDILVTEFIAPGLSETGYFGKSMVSLQRAVGVVQSCFDRPCIEVAPRSWRAHIPEPYYKADDNDAVMLGFSVLWAAQDMEKQERTPISAALFHKLKTGRWP